MSPPPSPISGLREAVDTQRTSKLQTPAAKGELSAPGREVFSQRLIGLLEEIHQGRAPNAGRFCGYCYHPLAPERVLCPHCGRSTADWPAAFRIPDEVIAMQRARRSREGLMVWSIAWGGLLLGVAVALLPLVFAGATWWAILSFLAVFAFFYILSANLANSLGDALGYRWGQALVRRCWQEFVARRDGG